MRVLKTATQQRGTRRAEDQRSPARALLFGLIITLAAVVAYSAYITVQISGLRKLQSEMVDRNRRDSLQLLRLQNDLNSVALAMRDMLDSSEPYPMSAWSAQFERLRGDIDAALTVEEQNASAQRTEEQRDYLRHQLTQFWDAMDRMFALANNGKEADAKEQIRLSLQAREAALSTAVSRLLVENNEGEQRAASQIGEIYTRVQRNVYLFFAATLVAIVLTSLYLIRTNREIFARLAALVPRRKFSPAASIPRLELRPVRLPRKSPARNPCSFLPKPRSRQKNPPTITSARAATVSASSPSTTKSSHSRFSPTASKPNSAASIWTPENPTP